MEMVLDVVIIVLVAVLIGYSIILNLKLKTFRNSQNEMAAMVGQLNEAISKAQSSVASLKQAASTEEARLEELVVKARRLADELAIITESGANLADRIERGLLPGASDRDDGDIFEEEEDEAEGENEMLETLKKVR